MMLPATAALTTTIEVLRATVQQTMQAVFDEGARRTMLLAQQQPNAAAVSSPKVVELRLLWRILLQLNGRLAASTAVPHLFRPWLEAQCAYWVGIARRWALREDTPEMPAGDPDYLTTFLAAEAPGLAAFEEQTRARAQRIVDLRAAVTAAVGPDGAPSVHSALGALLDELVSEVERALSFVREAFHAPGVAEEGLPTVMAVWWLHKGHAAVLAETRLRAAGLDERFQTIEAYTVMQLEAIAAARRLYVGGDAEDGKKKGARPLRSEEEEEGAAESNTKRRRVSGSGR